MSGRGNLELHRDSRPDTEGMLIHIDSAFIVEACGVRVLSSWLPRPRSSTAHLVPRRRNHQSPATTVRCDALRIQAVCVWGVVHQGTGL